MARRSYIVAIAIIILAAVVPGVYFLGRLGETEKSPAASADTPEIVDVDAIAKNPESFKGIIGVTGKVIKVDEPNTTFALGCADECAMMPVRYSGKMPDLNSEVVVYGEVKMAEGGLYVFAGKDIEPR